MTLKGHTDPQTPQTPTSISLVPGVETPPATVVKENRKWRGDAGGEGLWTAGVGGYRMCGLRVGFGCLILALSDKGLVLSGLGYIM